MSKTRDVFILCICERQKILKYSLDDSLFDPNGNCEHIHEYCTYKHDGCPKAEVLLAIPIDKAAPLIHPLQSTVIEEPRFMRKIIIEFSKIFQ
jgi:hypothetical protein